MIRLVSPAPVGLTLNVPPVLQEGTLTPEDALSVNPHVSNAQDQAGINVKGRVVLQALLFRDLNAKFSA